MYQAADFNLEGQVSVITGSGAGIGCEIAKTFAHAGAAARSIETEGDGIYSRFFYPPFSLFA